MNDRFSADDLSRKSGLAPRAIDLAHTPSFNIGGVEVRPQSRELIAGERRELLEPLVMQVLVALHSAKGATLSRDDLIDACWGGRAVSDDAISRVASRLRSLGKALGAFEVETIPKIGYRLLAERGSRLEEDWRGFSIVRQSGGTDRRALLAGGGALLAAGGAYLAWRQPWRHQPPPQAADLFRRAEITLRQGFGNSARQAISFYSEAVRIDPLYAPAWGAMALAYTHLLEGYSEAEMGSIPSRLRSAARRALELDPDNADAQLSLILIEPSFRNWRQMESRLGDFNRRHPDHWLGIGRLAQVMDDVGRLEQGIKLHKRTLEIDPMLPVGQAYLANVMLNTDRLQETEQILDEAQERWPGHPSLWGVRYKFLLYNGRPQAAAAFVMNPDLRPTAMPESEVARFARLAQAVDKRQPQDIATSIADFEARAREDVHNIPTSAAAFALLGRADLTFASLERYYFNEGEFGRAAPIEQFTRRYTRELFARPLAPFRSHARYQNMLQRIGLEDYWRQSRTVPDFRRG